MIYLSDDYVDKYCNTLSYLIGRSYQEKYTFDYIEKRISHSLLVGELEQSNITLIAFSSMEKIYSDIFPTNDNNYNLDIYGVFGWIGYAYMHLFLSLNITFESLFNVISIEEMMDLYHLYHEMDINQLIDHAKEIMKYSLLDVVMKRKKISSKDLGEKTKISISTITALRYGKRDIGKLEINKALTIANALNIKITSLLTNIQLEKSMAF